MIFIILDQNGGNDTQMNPVQNEFQFANNGFICQPINQNQMYFDPQKLGYALAINNNRIQNYATT